MTERISAKDIERCHATLELANGEYVEPCRKVKGHAGEHYGICLGSPCGWEGGQHTTEEELWKRETP